MISLRWRLPLLIAAVMAAVFAAFVWAAHRTVETTLLRAGEERLQVAADQFAALLNRGPVLEEARAAASDVSLHRLLGAPTPEHRRAALERLTALADGSPVRRVELWDERGVRVLVAESGAFLPELDPPFADGVGPLRAIGGRTGNGDVPRLFYDVVSAVGAGGARGRLAMRVGLVTADPRAISRLVGEAAVALLGNSDGALWTDLNGPVDGRAIGARAAGLSSYVDARGVERIGAAAHVAGAPWIAWVEFPRASIVAPASDFLFVILPIAWIVLVAGAAAASIVTSRITVPLADLSAAAEAVAAGDYARRVVVPRRDELGRLAGAFNAMTSQVKAAHHGLEARVEERTAELAAARADADKANRAKSEFLSLMSHDLRTPLNAILGFAQLLETEPLTSEQADHVRNILGGGRHLLALVSDVQDITRIEGGQLGLTIEPVALGPALRQAVELVRPLAAERGVVLRIDDDADGVTVRADGQRLSQVLLNLLSNAVKYNRTHGRVTVSAACLDNARCRIAVVDTGIGIAPEKVARLFQPFERLGAEQTGVEGTGLGLALSRALAAAMAGTISMSSTPGQGSTFWLELPMADAAGVREKQAATQDVPLPTPTRGVILYVEDNLSNVRLLERILQRRPGVELLHAQTGAAGLDMARRHLPDVVLLDLHLPDTTGEDVLRLLAADPRTRDIPKVIMTADATPGLGPRLEAAGARACMTKPLSVPAILGMIDRLLARPRPAQAGISAPVPPGPQS